MTTVAYDGVSIAADSLSTDNWGLISYTKEKIKVGIDFYIAFSGTVHQIHDYWKSIMLMNTEEILNHGYPMYDKEEDGLHALLCCTDGRSWWLSGSCFMRNNRGFHAIGSGRDFAIAAMHLGNSASDAVLLASNFDRGTGGEVIEYKIKNHPALIGN